MSSSSLDYLELCRLCLEKDRAQVPIFGEGEVSQIFLKIHACLPVKVSSDDKLPKKICDGCFNKVNDFYSYWNTTANAEKQLLQWLNQMEGLEDKQGYVTEVLDSNVMKQEQSSDSRLDGSVMQVSGHQNMDINMIENMSIITMPAGSEQQFTTVPIDTGGIVQTVQVSGPSTQIAHDQTHLQEVEVDEDEDNMDDGCDNDDGLPVKEETDEGDQSLEQRYVTLPCDEAGPSGLQQQKIPEMSEITIQQTADGDPKSGSEDKTTVTLYEVNIVNGEATYTFMPVRSSRVTTSTSESGQETKKYPCDKCSLEFVSEMRLQWHRATHDPLKKTTKKQTRKEKATPTASTSKSKLKFLCPTCDFNTNERQLMIEHYTNNHCAKANELKCDDEVEERTEVVEDEEVEEIELTELTCAECGFSSYDQDDLDFHTCSKPGEEPTSFTCHLCTYECPTRMGLQSHITRKHKPKSGSEVPVRYSCDVCDYKCANKSTMYSHKRKHRARASKRKQPAKETVKNEAKDEVQCTFFCNECDYSAPKKTSLYQHIKKSHSQHREELFHLVPGRKDLFSCDQCEYTNKNRYEMKVHVIRKHSSEYNHECEQCGKKYKIRGDLTNHIRFQHREQPIMCDVCGKTCGNSNSLYVHQKFAHYKAEFECPICHRRMVSQANLDEHVLKQHEQREDAICEECGKTFTRQSRLKIHMRIHLGIKPHACKLCGKAFSRKTALRQHLLIHTGQRPYVCDICGKTFTQKPGLISHRKSHPGTHPPLPRITIDHVLSDILTAQES